MILLFELLQRIGYLLLKLVNLLLQLINEGIALLGVGCEEGEVVLVGIELALLDLIEAVEGIAIAWSSRLAAVAAAR